ncbi:MAG: VWA domain-containing protein [Saprospiraceae bacterium]|nr:VWA domain-containing protein [Saprospiraceae bacterium]
MSHYTDYDNFLDSLVAFSYYVREEGLDIGINETMDAVEASISGLWKEEPFFQFALAALFCSNEEERLLFDRLYHRYWNEKGARIANKTTYKNQHNLVKKGQYTLAMMGRGEGNGKDRFHAKTTTGANKVEALRQTDFSLVSRIEDEMLTALSMQLVKEMSLRIRRKFKKANKKGSLDVGRTIRQSLENGGTLIRLRYQKKKKEKFKLVILLDVSGSMDKYSFYLLRFIWMLRTHFKHIEVFTFSTRLVRITDQLQSSLDISLRLLSHQTEHWSSGTKIGACLREFNAKYSKRMLNGRTYTVILSDGLDTGDTVSLEEQLKKIKSRTNKLIWLNPLKGMQGYRPIQKGMKVALPQIDVFNSAHNLQSLLTLEHIITNA